MPHSVGQRNHKSSLSSRCGEINSIFEGMSYKVTLQRVWIQRGIKDLGYFYNLSTLGTLIVNEASALSLCPQKLTMLDSFTVDCGVGAGVGWPLYLEYLGEGWWKGPKPRKPRCEEPRK